VNIPELSLVVLVGVSGSGKSTFAARHFKGTEVLSSDFCRGLVADDENDQSASAAAFDVLHYIAGKRLDARRLTVIDATNVQPEARKSLVAVAKEHDVLPVAIVLDVPESVCRERNANRSDRDFGPAVIRRQRDQLRRGLHGLKREGFRHVYTLRGVDEIETATVTRTRLFNDLRDQTGPFDVIGDVHGCCYELKELLSQLGYVDGRHPEGRRAVFLGDLVDRGPDTPGVLRVVMGMVAAGSALCVMGNHEAKLLRALQGRNVKVNHGLAESLEQLGAEPEEFRARVVQFLDGLISHYVLDEGRLVVSHAGLIERYQGRTSGRVREFCLYGQTTGETDEYGLPVRYPWAEEYRGKAMVLYGHTPVPSAEWLNNTMCLDTGCVFGGKLTALSYPERAVVSVPARVVHYTPAKPFPAVAARDPGVLDIGDVLRSRVIETSYLPRISVREGQAAAALEVMSRFALDPRLLAYLPPTMAPVATSPEGDLLEHPSSAFDSYRADGVSSVVCEEKHMGSRAVLSVRRDGSGAVWTRTGRSFFPADLTSSLLTRARDGIEKAGLFDELGTSWVLLDAEILPWSVKAAQLLRDQYAATGAAARAALPAAVSALWRFAARDTSTPAATSAVTSAATELLDRTRARLSNAEGFVAAYRRYCWDTSGLDGVRVAPFQLLATDGAVYHDRPHLWHLELADRLAAEDPSLFAVTRRWMVDVSDDESVAAGVAWWSSLTEAGGEGMVVKPAGGLADGFIQPGLKVRGREYLRIIYGPDYLEPVNLARLRRRALGHKRSLALREYALGLEALDRMALGEPLWRVHECVFAVLALESEPVDPRL
jgi:protein phosphatase